MTTETSFDMMVGPLGVVEHPETTTSQPFPWEGKPAMHDQSTTARIKHQVETGSKFGRWTVLGKSERTNVDGERPYFSCRCDCGTVGEVHRSGLTSGNSSSCGCLHRETVTKHGRSQSDVYGIWGTMIYRCTNPNAHGYENYGGRGIRVCDRWARSFEAFLEDMGPRPSPKHTIDRIDNYGHYEPGNVRWATKKEQSRNTRRNHVLEHFGRSMTIAEWAEETGLSFTTITSRLDRGWDVDRALSPDLAFLTGTKTHAAAKETRQRILEIAGNIPPGETPIMKEIAQAAGLTVRQVSNAIFALRKSEEWPHAWPSRANAGAIRTQQNRMKRARSN